MKIINFKNKKITLLTKEQRNYMKMQKSVIFVKIRYIVKLEISLITQGNIKVLHV